VCRLQLDGLANSLQLRHLIDLIYVSVNTILSKQLDVSVKQMHLPSREVGMMSVLVFAAAGSIAEPMLGQSHVLSAYEPDFAAAPFGTSQAFGVAPNRCFASADRAMTDVEGVTPARYSSKPRKLCSGENPARTGLFGFEYYCEFVESMQQ